MKIFLPIAHRELMLASRRRGTYWTRFCMAAAIGGILFAMALSTSQPASLVSSMIFWVLKSITFAYCLFAGVRFTADAISEERREGTLGLLFLTHLHGYDVVIGKMVITSLNAFFGLLAAIPLLAVPVMMGGVSAGEFWRTTLVLINTLFFSLSIGLVISAFGTHERNVMLATLFSILIASFGLPLCWKSLEQITPRWLEILCLFPSPAYALKMTGSGLFVSVASDFWPCMLTIATLTLAFIVIASIYVPRSFQETNSDLRNNGPLSHRSQRASVKDAVQAAMRRSLHPYLWRVSRDPSMAHWSLLMAGVTVVFGLYSLIVLGDRRLSGPKGLIVCGWVAVHWLIKILLTSEACRPFSEDKRNGTLELLLCSPIRPNDMIDAQRRRLRMVFIVPITVACVANLLISSAMSDSVPSTMFFLGIFTLPVDCAALRWVSMHFSVACSSFTRAVFSTLWRVMVPPWIALFVILLLLAESRSSESTLISFLVIWAIGTVVFDLWLITRKTLLLPIAFRQLAAGEQRSPAIQPAYSLALERTLGVPKTTV